MTLAGHNIQKELADVNNHWKWPSSFSGYKTGTSPSSMIDVEFWKWYAQVQPTGYMNINVIDATWPLGTFTHDSVSTVHDTGYSLGVFVNLEAGSYVFSCNASIDSIIYFIEYRKISSKWLWNRQQKYVTGSGRIETQFEVPEESCIMITPRPSVSGTKATGPYATFTDITIREGML